MPHTHRPDAVKRTTTVRRLAADKVACSQRSMIRSFVRIYSGSTQVHRKLAVWRVAYRTAYEGVVPEPSALAWACGGRNRQSVAAKASTFDTTFSANGTGADG